MSGERRGFLRTEALPQGLWQGCRGIHGGDPPVEPELLRLPGKAAFAQRVLEGSIFAQEARRGRRPYALGTRNPVGGISAQRDEVGNLPRFHPVSLLHLSRADPRGLTCLDW